MLYGLKKYLWVVQWLSVVVVAYFLGRLSSQYVAFRLESKSPTHKAGQVENAENNADNDIKSGIPEDRLLVIVKRNLFDADATEQESKPADTAAPVESDEQVVIDVNAEAVPTSLELNLYSTFSVGLGDDTRSSAVIGKGRGKESEGNVVRVGDADVLAPETKITKILLSRVEFLHKGRLEYIELEDWLKLPNSETVAEVPAAEAPPVAEAPTEEGEEKIEKTEGNKFTIARSEVDESLANLDRLYTQIMGVPYYKAGQMAGLKILRVVPNSIFSKLGLRRGDILMRINGESFDIRRGLELMNRLKSESNLVLELERRGQNQTFEYEIK
jgi:type II secretion system protein C